VEAQALYDHAEEPKQLVFLEDSGHTEWMFDEHPTFKQLLGLVDGHFSSALNKNSAMVGASATRD